ncbi:hypothetical protein Tcan_03267 [Toxocara canis]|uniref:Uncharacterized protein n=1 Tax=Toxocara canis TaxID=6265 RepID=A0A0B2VFA1_TOXCA|nr:hypothetical protein Tcan_03267 [Toxocara canis]
MSAGSGHALARSLIQGKHQQGNEAGMCKKYGNLPGSTSFSASDPHHSLQHLTNLNSARDKQEHLSEHLDKSKIIDATVCRGTITMKMIFVLQSCFTTDLIILPTIPNLSNNLNRLHSQRIVFGCAAYSS